MNVSIAMRDEPCEWVGDPQEYADRVNLFACHGLYRIADPMKRAIDPRDSVTPVVFRDGRAVPPTHYCIFWADGLIAFALGDHPASVTIDAAYFPREG